MTTYQLTQDVCEHNVPPTKTVTAECIHTDDDFIRFHDADHQLVYAVQRGLLLAIETVEDEDQADESAQTPDPTTHVVLEVDGSRLFDALTRAQLAAQRRNGNSFGGS